jgi:flagellar biosynthesis activator protein FlaF
MQLNQLKGYNAVSQSTMPGREVEASILTKAALKLRACQNNWGDNNQDSNLDQALRFNQRIWSIFQGELAKEDNPLPQGLKQDLLRLSAFIDKQIFEAMAYPSPDKLDIVIDINQNIAAGLRGPAAAN